MFGGAFLSAGASWHVVFWFSAALNFITVLLVLFAMPESTTRATMKLDTLGAAGIGVWLSCIVIAVDQSSAWGRTSPKTLAFLAMAVVGFALWLRHELRHPEPLVPIRVIANRRVLPCLIIGFSMAFASVTCFYGITNFAEVPHAIAGYGFGATVLGGGALLLPIGITEAGIALFVGGTISRLGARRVIIVSSLTGAALFVVWSVWHSSPWSFLLLGPVFAVSTLPVFTAGLTIAVTQVPRDTVGVVGSVYQAITAIGSVAAVAVLTAFTTAHLIPKTQISIASGFTHTFLAAAGICLLGGMLALVIPRAVGRNAFGVTREG
jgi:predicted MFS family arabinose efflux permease